MNNTAMLEIARMQNSFAQTAANPDLTRDTYKLALEGLSSQAVIEAAHRFITGDVPDQSKTFAPSIAEFVTEARKRQEIIDTIARPRIAARGYVSTGHLRPFDILRQKALTKFQDCPILHENISHAEFMALSKTGKIPVGAVWSAACNNVYGPPAEQISMGRRKQEKA
jgi:hypothetical protein